MQNNKVAKQLIMSGISLIVILLATGSTPNLAVASEKGSAVESGSVMSSVLSGRLPPKRYLYSPCIVSRVSITEKKHAI